MPRFAADYRHLETPGVQFRDTPDRLVTLEVANSQAAARLFVQGAHVAEWTPMGADPVLFVSSQSIFAVGKPIRGGIPVCFPWFATRAGHPELPAHGFGRTIEWNIESITGNATGGTVVVFVLSDSEATRLHWPYSFLARYAVTIGAALELALAVENTGKESFTFEAALHTYFRVADIRVASITGLENTEYIDKVKGGARKHLGAEPLRFTGETDRVFLNTTHTCELHDTGLNRRITVEKTGSATTVIWNPWETKAAAMADFGNSEWPSMACIETANAAENEVTLAPGKAHQMTTKITVR